ncbi:MAG: hypothetical protein HND53_08120 [Proteobacteria bacterium]|nr:hypothetical protein [Pseudomonadota bacterium]NOG60448.1 hypothetical protein [Pseudomonadota bacterium]
MISLQKSKSDFFNRRALFISADKVSVYHWNKGELGSSYLFDIDDAGRDNFERYLKESDNTPMTLLVDVIEEEFRQDTIPHVFGSDRSALIERKQSRLFRDTDYIHVLSQGREEEGRRDDRLLFIALTRQEIVKPWVELLDKYKVPLKGVLSVPLLLQSYIKTLPDISDHALFVTMQSISGLRQTFFQKKELKISRLSKLPRYGTESYAPRIESEVEKIQRYLNSLRLIPNDTALDVYIIADKSTLDELEKRSITIPMVKRHYYDVGKLLTTIQEGAVQTVPFSDQLLMSHLLKTQVKNCYASAKEMRYLKMRNIRYAMNAATIMLLFFSLIYSSLNFMGGLTYKQESESFKNKADFYQVRYDLARERLPKTPVEPAQIKVAVEAVAALEEYKATPYEMLSFLGKGLEQYPKIKLDELDWSFSLDPNKGAAAKENVNEIPTVIVDENNQVKYYQISNLSAHIEPFDGNYRDAIAMVNAFAKTLRNFDSTYSVSIESFPLDISSKATLQGNAQSTGKAALFTLRAVIGVN